MGFRNAARILGFILAITVPAWAEPKPDGALAKAVAEYTVAKAPAIYMALRKIMDLGPAHLDELKACVGDAAFDERVRDACLVGVGRALKEKDGEFYMPIIEKPGSTDDDRRLRARAAGLLTTRTPEAKALLKRLLEDPASEIRLKNGAAMGLARMGDGSGAEHALQQILKGNEGYLPLMVLTTLKDKSGVPRIKAAMEGRSQYQAEQLRMAIIKLESAGESEGQRVKRLRRAIEESVPSSQVPKDLCLELLRMRSTDAYQVLDELTHSKNKTAAFEATFVLQHSMLTGELSVSELKVAVGNTDLVKTTEKLLEMQKKESSSR